VPTSFREARKKKCWYAEPQFPLPRAEAAEDGLQLGRRSRPDAEHPLRFVAIAVIAQAGAEALSGSSEAREFLLGEGEFSESIALWCDVAEVPLGTIQRRFSAVVSSVSS
jgi:hypothetical protein